INGAREQFKAAADLSPLRSSFKITYAEYLARTGASAEATTYLETLTKKTPDFLAAWTLLARTALSEKKNDEALALLENIFSRDPDNVDARLLQADALLGKQQTQKAVAILEQVDINHPGAPGIKFQLARAYLQEDKPGQASIALKQAITANPNFVDAILLLARLDLRAGQTAQAIPALEGLLKKKPDLSRAQLLLADAYRAAGRLDDAAGVFRQQIARSPENAEAYTFLGLIQEQQKQPDEARRSLEKALQLNSDNSLALSKLVELDLAANDFDAAMRRVEGQMQKEPSSGNSYLLKGKVLTAKKQWPEAETTLKKAIELDPNLAPAYDLLVGIYLETGKSDQAIRELEAVLAASPRNKGALMTVASVEEKRGAFTKAADAYQKLLAFDPNNITALNNLAYIYAERLNQGDKGLEMARKAYSLAPGNPAVSDTLGWILFKRDDYQQAVPLLEEAGDKIKDNPEVRFHSGMAHYMMGQADAARSDFEQALSMKRDFPSKHEAEQRLQLLNQTTGNGSGGLTAEQLENMLKQHPKDIVARLRLAEVYKAKEDYVHAAATYEELLKLNPNLGKVALELAELNAGPLKNPQKALAFAKKARELLPSDPQAAGILGRIAFNAGNFQWAYSLLQEGSRQAEADPRVWYDLAWAAYSLGKVEQARQAMQQSLDAAPDSAVAADAKTFLLLTDQNISLAAKDEIKQKLEENPPYVPALVAAAGLDAEAGRKTEAVKSYQAVLQRFPEFSPAQKALAFLYAEDPARREEAFDLATRARKGLPADAGLARLLGRLSFEKKEYSRALQLLQEGARKEPLDAEGLYYLGLSYKETKQANEAKKALQAAQAAGLPPPLAESARKALADLQKP
ncbi:MAG: tetratricopeptide repeat protein, partial [Blastocatellia bacterium]|nr:tetratricopeptide repeat protein [Blastocatellia bacterium]